MEVEIGGSKGGLESLIPLASRRFLCTQLYPLPSLPPPKKVPNPLAKTCIRKWNWNGWGRGVVMSLAQTLQPGN